MRIFAKVIGSMPARDATQQWTGQPSAMASRKVWSWGGGDFTETSTVF